MRISWTEGRYKAELIKKFGTDKIFIGKFPQKHTNKSKLIHKCTECSETYETTIKTQLNKDEPICLKCSYHNRSLKNGTKEKDFLVKLKKKFDYIQCLEYNVSAARKALFQCECGYKWEATPKDILNAKVGCPECAKLISGPKRQTIPDIQKRVDELGKKITLLTKKRKTVGNKISNYVRAKCDVCGFKWSVYVHTLTCTKVGCPECAKRLFINPLSKEILLNGKTVIVQGYEDFGIQHLINKGIPEHKIQVFSEGKIPTIGYVYQNKLREYWPDIKVNNTIVEVKSAYTLLSELAKNKAKAKACIKEGFDFRLLLCDVKRNFFLPKDWLSWNELQIKNYITKKLVSRLRILSIDPGSKNFAWSVIEITRPFEIKLEATGMLRNTIQSLTDNIEEQTVRFLTEIETLVDDFSIDHIIMERFMYRMGIKGITMELVNVMIGTLLSRYNDKLKLITASQWKNEWNRFSDLKEFYTKVNCTVHQVDSIGIGLYGASMWFGEKPFSDIKSIEKVLPKMISKSNYEL